ncbi:MAG: MAPEG family protein [Hyphomicrobiaceae bacterium]
MSQTAIVLPVFAQVLLTFVVLIVMAMRRRNAFATDGVKMKDIALGQSAWPDEATKAANNFRNQFETPVLFYVACIIALVTKSVDYAMVAMAWVYVASRVGHALIHLGSNIVMQRFYLYLVGLVALLIMWILLFVRVGLGA